MVVDSDANGPRPSSPLDWIPVSSHSTASGLGAWLEPSHLMGVRTLSLRTSLQSPHWLVVSQLRHQAVNRTRPHSSRAVDASRGGRIRRHHTRPRILRIACLVNFPVYWHLRPLRDDLLTLCRLADSFSSNGLALTPSFSPSVKSCYPLPLSAKVFRWVSWQALSDIESFNRAAPWINWYKASISYE